KLDVIQQLDEAGVAAIALSGGEPTIHPHFFTVVREAAKRGMYVAVATNGWMMADENFVKKMKEAGVRYVEISIDSPDPKKHDRFRGVPGAWERAVKAVRNAVKYGLHTAIAKKLKILKFGTSTDLSGSNSFLGKEMSSGIKLAFEKINREGGINGHQLKLIVLDDSYEPEKTLKNMLKLINTYKVLGIVGNVGTPTGVVAMEVAIKNRILFFAPLTGANALRPKPPSPYVYHYRASYYEELDVLLSNFLKCKKLTPLDIAFFTQNDAYGDEIYDAGIDILKKFGLKDEGKILHLRYPRNTLYVYSAAAKFLRIKPHPKAIVLGCSYNACIRFIKVLREYNYNGYFLGVSFVGTDALGKKAKEKPEIYKNILVANVTPLPTDSSYPIVKEY
ncbi:MAG TPA: radical SAM protein, partial [Pyrodictiaceae archaeon]|nr:radical SAM protein [Pyrodictiaceae archaeon]